MAKTMTARDVGQAFARYVRDVEAGEEYTITRNGQPVARLVPAQRHRSFTAAQQSVLARTRARMAQGWPIEAEQLDRAALYDRC